MHHKEEDVIEFCENSFTFQEERFPDHYFHTQIPNIIEELKLDVYEFRVYWQIKRIAGDQSRCFYNLKNLAEKCGMSKNKLIQCLKSLMKVHPLLKTPLIKKYRRKDKNNKDLSNVFEIVDIWSKNGTFYNEKFKNCKNQIRGARHEPIGVHGMNPMSARHEPKEETKEENKKQQQKEKTPKPKPSAAAVVFSEKLEEKLKEFKGITERERGKWKELYTEERILTAIRAVKSSDRENPLLSLRAALRDGWEPSEREMKKERLVQFEKMKQKIFLDHRVLVDLMPDKFVFMFGEEVPLSENLNEVWSKLLAIAKNYKVI